MSKSENKMNKIPLSMQAGSRDLYARIAANLDIKPTRQSRQYAYRTMVRRRYYSKRIGGALVAAAIVIACAALYLLPATISNIDTELSDRRARISFSLGKPALVKDVSAQLNSSPISVGQEDGYYFVDVSENGILILETEMVTGVHTTTDIVIDSLDDQSPSIANHSREGDDILIYLTDNEDGTGVDFAAITAYEPDTGNAVEPLYYDEEAGLVAFSYPERTIRIIIPDKAGNAIAAVLEPYVLKS